MNPNETLGEKLIRCGWVTDFNVKTLVKLIERHYKENEKINSNLFEVHLNPELDKDISDFLKDFPEIGNKSEFAKKAFSFYIVAKRREKVNGEKIGMIKNGCLTVELVNI